MSAAVQESQGDGDIFMDYSNYGEDKLLEKFGAQVFLCNAFSMEISALN